VSPLIAAIASATATSSRCSSTSARVLDRPQNRDAWCFARALGDETMQHILADAGADANSDRCPRGDWDRNQAPLGWLAR
jgi:hypothetical protein